MASKHPPLPDLPDMLDAVEGELGGCLDDLVRIHLPMLSPTDKDFAYHLIYEVARHYMVGLRLRKQAHGGQHQVRKQATVERFKKTYIQTLADLGQLMGQITNDPSVAPLLPHQLGNARAEAALVRLLTTYHAFDDEAQAFKSFIKPTVEKARKTTTQRDAAVKALYEGCKAQWKKIHPISKKDKFFHIVKVFILASDELKDCPDNDVCSVIRSADV